MNFFATYEKHISFFDVLKQYIKECPMNYIHFFLLVCRYEGSNISFLAKKINLPLSTVSRIAHALDDYIQNGKPGYGLIKLTVDPENNRSKIVTLTDKGLMLSDEIRKIL